MFSTRPRFTPTDALLLLVVTIWGSNFTVVKATLEQIPPLGFNALRLALACLVLVVIARCSGATVPDRADWPRLVGLGLAGHCGYQLSFILGLARTSVTNSSLILGCLPVTVLLLNAVSSRREPVVTCLASRTCEEARLRALSNSGIPLGTESWPAVRVAMCLRPIAGRST